ncbi:MAG: hypothetical protein ACRECY_11125, partial [Phyllobacterium sp.]
HKTSTELSYSRIFKDIINPGILRRCLEIRLAASSAGSAKSSLGACRNSKQPEWRSKDHTTGLALHAGDKLLNRYDRTDQ